MWRVGDGCSIDIWGHRWLSDQANSTIISPRNNSTVRHVKDLFYPGTRIWDLRLLERMFVPWEVELIKLILITLDENYSVQSAYGMLVEEASSQDLGSSSMEGSQKVWKGIWKIRTPNKIRHFIWHAARDSLPTK